MKRLSVDRPYAAVRREITLDVSYARFTGAFESLLGEMDVGSLREIATQPQQSARERLASFVGPSGFALFQKIDHGGLLTALTGRKSQAMTYVFGNALIAIEMTSHAPSVGLYVPLRLYVYATGPAGILVTYDLPSAMVAQFGSPPADAVAGSLDGKVEQLITDAAERAGRQHDS